MISRGSRLIWSASDIRSRGRWSELVNTIMLEGKVLIACLRSGHRNKNDSLMFFGSASLLDTANAEDVPVISMTQSAFYQPLMKVLKEIREAGSIVILPSSNMICTSKQTAENIGVLGDNDDYQIDSETLENSAFADDLKKVYVIR